ncbi:DUF7262 family protein [Halobellus sp. EA9]|uniref:DUF7262 family protein n=1 Tax=Halobellus sp. EA9 TaxID=3421647 RepID=UPI003EBBEB1E
MSESTDRGQLATSLVEAVVGALLVLAVVAGFLWAPVDDGRADAEPDRLAADALAVLHAEAPAGSGRSRLTAACRSPASFATERAPLRARLEAVLPPGAFGRVATPHGSVGPPIPTTVVESGRARLDVGPCAVALRVWFP